MTSITACNHFWSSISLSLLSMTYFKWPHDFAGMFELPMLICESCNRLFFYNDHTGDCSTMMAEVLQRHSMRLSVSMINVKDWQWVLNISKKLHVFRIVSMFMMFNIDRLFLWERITNSFCRLDWSLIS